MSNSYFWFPSSLSRFTNLTSARAEDVNARFDEVSNGFDGVSVDILTKAPLASPALTGVPTAPTAAPGTNNTQIATTAFVASTAFSSALPAQTGNSGKYLTTDGTTASWGVVNQPTFPSGAVVGTTDVQTLTNKTINGTNNTITNVSLTTGVTGVLPTANGGTGSAFFAITGPTVARTYTFPNVNATVLTSASAVTIAQGGTGAATQQAAINALAGAVTANRVLRADGTNVTLGQVALTTDVTGTLPVANGGTGAATLSGLVKGNGTGAFTAAVANTDFVPPVNPTMTGTVKAETVQANTTVLDEYGTEIGAATSLVVTREDLRVYLQRYGGSLSSGAASVSPLAFGRKWFGSSGTTSISITESFIGNLVSNGWWFEVEISRLGADCTLTTQVGTSTFDSAGTSVTLKAGCQYTIVRGPSADYNVYKTGGDAVEVLTSGTSWTPPAGIRNVRAKLVGGGGSGGSGTASGGASGGYGEFLFSCTPGTAITYSIGAGGAGVASGAGNAGGSTTFSTASVSGGGGGKTSGTASDPPGAVTGGTAVVSIAGAVGVTTNGAGGRSALGAGGSDTFASSVTAGYGGGGRGVSSGTSGAGGNGVIILEY